MEKLINEETKTDAGTQRSVNISPRYLNFLSFSNKLKVCVEKGKYLVKTVETYEEFHQAMELRQEVFFKEFAGKSGVAHTDTDKYDYSGDILIIKDNEKNEVVGTYRLISTLFSDQFYSQSEFDIDSFLSCSGEKLELSRACVRREHRQGIVLHLLWRGLAAYVEKTGTQYLFGCSSVQTIDRNKSRAIYDYLAKEGYIGDRFEIDSLPEFKFQSEDNLLEDDSDSIVGFEPAEQISPLLKSYLKAGAKIYGEPAVDRFFNCIDFFTVLDFTYLNDSHVRKYNVQR